MSDRAINRVSFFVALALALALLFLAERSAHSQTVKPAQHQAAPHTAPHTAPPVRPATACRVRDKKQPLTPWGSCAKAEVLAIWFMQHGVKDVWVENKIEKEK